MNSTYAVHTGEIALGDWNGDGRQDIAVAYRDSITLLQNQGPFPAVSVPVEVVSAFPHAGRQAGTRGVMVIIIRSTDAVEATHIQPETIRLGGAPVPQAGRSGRYLCQAIPMGKTSRPRLRCEVKASALTSEPSGTFLLQAVLNDGTRIKGETILKSQ